jgi:hypothetical protein
VHSANPSNTVRQKLSHKNCITADAIAHFSDQIRPIAGAFGPSWRKNRSHKKPAKYQLGGFHLKA